MTVIVPIGGTHRVLESAIYSLRKHTKIPPNRIIFLLDGISCFDVYSTIKNFFGNSCDVFFFAEKKGYLKVVNDAFRCVDSDLVLLNSDCVVTEGWLDKLQETAYSSSSVATVTPLSNNATLASVPVSFANNFIPRGYDLDSFAALINSLGGCPVEVPTGVGMCIYIRKDKFLLIGGFDEIFSPGYGEEDDFCQAARKLGFVNLLDTRTFVWHEGGATFKHWIKTLLLKRNRLIFQIRYPYYYKEIAELKKNDCISDIRKSIIRSLGVLKSKRDKKVLFVVHGWPPFNYGGTEYVASELAYKIRNEYETTVVARITREEKPYCERFEYYDKGVRVILLVNNFLNRNPLTRNSIYSAKLSYTLTDIINSKPDIVHVHHIMGLAFNFLIDLKKRGSKLVLQLNDWFLLCQRSNMWDPLRGICDGPGLIKCSKCFPFSKFKLLPPLLVYIKLFYARKILKLSDRIVSNSYFLVDSFRKFGLLDEDLERKIDVLPLGVKSCRKVSRNKVRLPLHVGVIASNFPHKGLGIALKAADFFTSDQLILHIWGSRGENRKNVIWHGSFHEKDKDKVFSSIDILVVPSLGYESFGIVVSEAFSYGIPVIASRRGALVERFKEGEGGLFFTPGDFKELAAILESFVREPTMLENLKRSIKPPRSFSSYTESILSLYESLTNCSVDS